MADAVQEYDSLAKYGTTAALLSSLPTDGALGYSKENMRYYSYRNGTWEILPNQSEIRMGYVTGVQKMGLFPYLAKATSTSGTITFWLTSNGLSTGSPVFSEIAADGITISPYGTSNAYQIGVPVVSADRKSVTASITQTSSVLLGLLSFTTASNGVDCRCIVMGK